MSVSKNSRQLAGEWPYPRQNQFIKEIRKAAIAWFKSKGISTNTSMPYCIASNDDWRKNIILDEVVSFLEEEQKKRLGNDSFALHKYLHHGLSSQAMLFNLVGPMIARNDFTPLRDALRAEGIPWSKDNIEATLEYTERDIFNEDAGQPTSIDLAIFNKDDDPPLFIESKLVETEFGGCSVFGDGDCEGMNPVNDLSICYLHHIGRLYWQRMEEYGFFGSILNQEKICVFGNYYQFFREVLFALQKNGHFVLLYDERNPVFIKTALDGKQTRGLWPFLLEFVPLQQREKLHIITIQKIVQSIQRSVQHKDWIGDFKTKYGL